MLTDILNDRATRRKVGKTRAHTHIIRCTSVITPVSRSVLIVLFALHN